MTFENLAAVAAQGFVLGLVPITLIRSCTRLRLVVDLCLGVAGCVAMAWFLAPLRIDPAPLAEPGVMTGLGSGFLIALGRIF